MSGAPWLSSGEHANLVFYAHLPVLIVIISLVYSATRFERWHSIWREAVRWGLRMTGFLLGIAVILYVMAALI
jgi:hypothetical protein